MINMKTTFGFKVVLPALVFGVAIAAPVYAQEDSPSASQSMHRAGESAENAASDTGHAVTHAYHCTATALSDSSITAKVKYALHENKRTQAKGIHVDTEEGQRTAQGTGRA